MVEGLNNNLLKRLYIKEGKSLYTIAKMVNCSSSTIRYWCKKYGVSLRPSQKGKLKGLNREKLEKWYITEQKSIYGLAKMLDCSATSLLIQCKKYGIKIRPGVKEVKGLSKVTLQRLYIEEDKSTDKIAEIFSCSVVTVRNKCRKYGIKLRGSRWIRGLNKSLLQRLYVKEGKSLREIAKIVGCSREVVRKRCKHYGIKLRFRPR
jgi:transposase